MTSALEKLTKYLELEADRGYDNRAILGGLERILEPWQAEAREEGLPEAIIDAVASRIRDYQRLSPASRETVIAGLIKRIQSDSAKLHAPARPSKAHEAQEAAPDSDDILDEDETVDEVEEGVEDEAELATEPAAGPGPDQIAASMAAPLTAISGIGPKSAKTLARLGLQTLGDLLWHLPRRYDDYSQLKTINRLWYGEEVTIIGTVEEINVRPVRSGKMKLVEATISDGTGAIRVTWFNQAWIANRLPPGKAVVLSGKVDQYLGRLTMNSPEWEPVNRQQLHTNRIVPVYPLTSGVSGKWLRRVMNSVVTRLARGVPDPLPESVRLSTSHSDLGTALQQVHFPDSWERLRAAQRRLAFDEMFLLQIGVLRQKQAWESLQTRPLPVEDSWLESFLRGLPFELTQAQRKVLDDIRADLSSGRPMNRLLQGDVGSGKTVLAAAALAIAHGNGSQSTMMAPTSILAEQHYQTLLSLLPAAGDVRSEEIRLLIGATPEAEKAEIRAGLEDGSISVVVGTHALLEDPVKYRNLGMAIIDEQHRFGVEQRAALRSKGESPNLMVMTATPIPRSLALTIFGDLDLSLLDELPPGRQEIETRVLHPAERSRAYAFIKGQLDEGRQAFVIYPLVEASEKVDAKAAVEESERLQQEVFVRRKVGLLHGRMSGEEKEAVMDHFRRGDLDVLVSTSVVEVGVDIPNASVMLIEGANRFGLSQLHQFRGRVGRGPYKSYCLLIPENTDEVENERLKAMESTNDGFVLAELDLEQRGPGDFFGTRQHGFAELKMAALTDVALIEQARREAKKITEADPALTSPEHKALAEEVDRFWQAREGEIS